MLSICKKIHLHYVIFSFMFLFYLKYINWDKMYYMSYLGCTAGVTESLASCQQGWHQTWVHGRMRWPAKEFTGLTENTGHKGTQHHWQEALYVTGLLQCSDSPCTYTFLLGITLRALSLKKSLNSVWHFSQCHHSIK